MKVLMRAVFMLALAIPLAAQTHDWPGWRGPLGNNTSAETGWNPLALRDGAKVLWTADLNAGYSGVAIKDNRLYAMGRMRSNLAQLAFYCMDTSTGKVIWQRSYKIPGTPQSTPTIDGDRLFALSGDGTLLCLRAGDGELVWKKDLVDDFHALRPGWGWCTSPIVEGELLLLGANSRGLALNKLDGNLVWAVDDVRQESSANPDEDGVASVVVADIQGKRVALFSLATMLCGVDVATGKKLWSYTLPPPDPGNNHDPVVSGGRVFIPDWSILLEPSGDQPKELWTAPARFGSWPAPALMDGHLYGTDWPSEFLPSTLNMWNSFQRQEFVFFCMDLATGNVVWKVKYPWVSLTMAGGKIIALELNGTLHIADVSPSGFTELSNADVFGGAKKPRAFAVPPVLCNGKIYCRNYAGELLCIDVGM